jgi:hypothetical protein
MEILFCIRGKQNTDFYLDIKLPKRGQVIDVQQDGWQWSERELTNPDWRIVRVSIPRIEAEALKSPEPKASPDHDTRLLRKRGFRLNVDFASLPQGVKNFLLDDVRSTPIGSITTTRLREIVTAESPVSDPRIIGPQFSNVIG